MVHEAKERSGFPIRRTLAALAICPSSYYRWVRTGPACPAAPRSGPGTLYRLLPEERGAIVDYALSHPEVRHRELAWKMLDEGVCAVSASSVYRVLGEEHLIGRWAPKARAKGQGRQERPGRPDELWQTDIRYTKVNERSYYLLTFMDVYSRYIVYHELLRTMDGLSVSIAAAAALAALPAGATPTIQSDHGSCFISGDFAATLRENRITHTRIRPHTPTDNAEIERCQRTIGEAIDQQEPDSYGEAQRVVDAVIDHYNHERLHSALGFLRPIDYYRGNPEALLAERRRKLATAREIRKQQNLKLRQRLIPFPDERLSLNQNRVLSHFL
ncbi:MAG: DDE-type integrase/transposase/recombinase [Phycisphaerae bacterium]|nr:DDE-type integrase/transposase/recombinase [Phycisphaerae bacterium]